MSRTRLFLIGWLVTVVFYLALELALVAVGFRYSRFPRVMLDEAVASYIAWQKENEPLQQFEPHPERMWTAKPGVGKVNAAGYQGKIIPPERTPGRLRLLFVGDSCTNSGPDQYPEMVVRELGERGVRSEALIAGVGGYSTYQGLHFLRESLRYKPDAVVAYFGWNDHWYGPAPDNEFRPLTDFDAFTYRTLGRLRTYQLIHYWIFPPRDYEGPQTLEALLEQTRVPPFYYRRNIEEMIQAVRERQIPIFFIAAPASTDLATAVRAEPFSPDVVPALHQVYRQILGQVVSREEGAHVVSFDPPDFSPTLMRRDGIHPSRDGYAKIAARVVEVMLREEPALPQRASARAGSAQPLPVTPPDSSSRSQRARAASP